MGKSDVKDVILNKVNVSKVILNKLKETETDLGAVMYAYHEKKKTLSFVVSHDGELTLVKIKKLDIDTSLITSSIYIKVNINDDGTITISNIKKSTEGPAGASRAILESMGVTRF